MRLGFIDQFLNETTMYRLTLYYLAVLVSVAIVLSALGILAFSPVDILIDTAVAIVGCYVGNIVLAKIFGAVTNIESVFITALILVLIIPVKFPANLVFFLLASAFAMGSKYFVTIEKRHIFNPAAVAVAGVAMLSPERSATWWIGTPAMLPFVLLGGILLLRKIQREQLVFTFLVTYLLIVAGSMLVHTNSIASIVSSWETSVSRSALFFFMFVMLTEPLTSPPTIKLQKYYAVIVAILYATPQIRFITAFPPELALCIGNVFSYIVSPKYRLILRLKEKIQMTADTILFNFGRVEKFSFISGQYMEWTLPHSNVDTRGNRRYFSIASAPSEELMIAVKFYQPSSTYKRELHDLNSQKEIIAASLSGDFVLPEDPNKPIVFIAGGVGIAPFRSIIQDLINKNQNANIVLLFANRTENDIIFADIFAKAQANGIKTVYTLTDEKSVPKNWKGYIGHVNAEMIQKEVPDYKTRMYYISGPQPMVRSYEELLGSLGIPSSQVIVDYFPGYNAE